MLRVVYEATQTLAPGELVEIHESRGLVHVKVQYGTLADDYLEPLNAALHAFVKQCGWFQIWRGQIISANSPSSPLTVRYIADPSVGLRAGVQIRESQGVVRLHVCPGLPSEILVRILNPAIEKFLAGKQWFQLWQGEIVTMDSPEMVTV